MAEAVQEQRMTVREFLRWQGAPDVRYELIDGLPVAMSPPKSFHRTIVANAARVIGNRLLGREPCRAEAEAGVWLAEDEYYVADLAVTCAPPRNSEEVEAPILIVEVLSRSTLTDDLGRKVPDYQELPSVAEIWAIDSERRRARIWRRDGERWVMERYLGAAVFESGVLRGSVELDELYANTGL